MAQPGSGGPAKPVGIEVARHVLAGTVFQQAFVELSALSRRVRLWSPHLAADADDARTMVTDGARDLSGRIESTATGDLVVAVVADEAGRARLVSEPLPISEALLSAALAAASLRPLLAGHAA